ncbi:hypothetical protein ACTXGQ_24165, partial [Marinobacter sp. 1Y8]
YQIASNNHSADNNNVTAIKKVTRRWRHVGFGCLLSDRLFFDISRFKSTLSKPRLSKPRLSDSRLRERDESKREKTERSDIGFALINKGFDHSKVYNTLTIQFE